ncbi:uroporphyrinogen-III synthase [uncultured Brevundimonas sp.]|uniref:uroporphyrinogen-III synthase n=1 Tax=uncultured Brevundimonas sp. TaxID=213418 RepID=UPI0030EF64E5|tara:strand:+ start:1828 stop:2529 length:702 start_codon:yes stop_codon:yes gene_type:complete
MARTDGSGPRVWITRARPGAERTAAALSARGFTPVVAPALALVPLDTPLDLTGVAGLAFTSRNGVAAFADRTPRRDWPVFTVGDATAEAARARGFTRVHSADGALDDLVALIAAAWPADGGLILAPGPRDPAGDLTAALTGRVEVRALPLYAALETDLAPPGAFDAVLVHSPRAARVLAARLAAADVGSRLLVAISPAAAAPLEGAGFAEIRIARRPTEDSLLAALGNPVRPV